MLVQVQDNLLYWDTVEKKLKPQLATEWKRLNPNTLEFKLRQNVKFHDGSEFSADDVVYTFEAAIDPKYNFRLKETRYTYLDRVEKVDKYTVRIHVKEGSGVDLINIAKDTKLGEKTSIQFRAEIFNILNHTNFNVPAQGIFSSSGAVAANQGTITSIVGTSRQIQFGLKLLF